MFNFKIIKKIFFVILILIIIIYIIFRSNSFFTGPKIIINYPIDGQKIETSTFFVEGNIKNSKEIKLNGREINVDLNGNFKEEIISHSPITIITIVAIDKYKNKKEKILKVVY